MTAKRSLTHRQLDLKYQFRFKLVDATASTIQRLIPWTALVLIAYFFHSSVGQLAGKTTMADIGLNILGDIRINEALAWAIAGGSGYLAYKERKLKENTIERLTAQTKKYEQALDPRRSSSRLTSRGKTRPEDKP